MSLHEYPNRARRLRQALSLIYALSSVLVSSAIAAPSALAQNVREAPPPAAAPGEEARRVVIRFLTEGDFPPFNYYDDEGVLSGLNVDLARALCQEVQAACDIKVRPWDELIPAMKRGDADAVIAAHKLTAESLGEVEFTDRYFHTPGRFATRTGTNLDISPEGLDDKAIAVARGSAHEAFLKTFFRDSRIQPFESQDLAREALLQSKVDAVFDDGISLAFWINGSLSRQCCELKGGAYLEPRFFGEGIAIAVPPADPQIKHLINGALQKLRQSGRLQEIVDRYFPTRIY